MRTIDIRLYLFNELASEVQKNILEKFRYVNTDYNWWESTFEYWKEMLELKGFINPNIRFSGFYSQGDGASFTSGIDTDILFDCYAKTIPDSNIKDTINIHYDSLKFYLHDDIKFSINRLTHHYSHENTVSIECEMYRDFPVEIETVIQGFKDWLEDIRISLCREIYRDLEREYEFLTSNETVEETINTNEYEFLEDGRIYA